MIQSPPPQQHPTLQHCIQLLQQSREQIKQKLSTSIQKLKKNIILSLDKIQKLYINKIYQIFSINLDHINQININQLYFISTQKCYYLTNKFINTFKMVNVQEEFKSISNFVKNKIQQIKKFKIFQSLPSINLSNQLIKLQKSIKIQNQPLNKIIFINNKLIQIYQNTVTIQKNTINKTFDLILPIKFTNKHKQIIFTLHDQTIGIYNNKLILHSYKKFQYHKNTIISATYLFNYVIIAQLHKITRININNLNQIVTRIFNDDILTLGNQLYYNLLQIGTNQRVILLDFTTLQPLTFIAVQSRVKKIIAIKDSPYLLVSLQTGLRIYKNLQLLQQTLQQRIRDILQATTYFNKYLIITNQLHIYQLNLYNEQNNIITIQRINQGITKNIKNVVWKGYQMYCLAENGWKIYVYSF